ncbi:MAG: MerR family transcriptional regulator [Alphaproteobacteria bacterium]
MHAKNVPNLSQNDGSVEQEALDFDASPSENQDARRADAAQKSARTKKSKAAFRTISEVAQELGVQQHVLRFWETKFSQIKPLKRGGGRRYYRPEDLELLQAIHHLLYIEGYTIKGVQKLLRDAGKKQIVSNFSGERKLDANPQARAPKQDTSAVSDDSVANGDKLSQKQKRALEDVLAELQELRGMVKGQR